MPEEPSARSSAGARHTSQPSSDVSTRTGEVRRRAFGGTVPFLIALALLAIWIAIEYLLLVFLGILLAILLRTVAEWISERTPLSVGLSLAVTILAILGLIAAGVALVAPGIAEQVDEVAETLPPFIQETQESLQEYAWGRWILEQMEGAGGGEQAMARATRAVTAMFHGIVGLVVILFVGVYLAADPDRYWEGVLRLVPVARRRRAAELIHALRFTLQWWLIGQLMAMALVAALTTTGLLIIGVPAALALGLLAGISEFVPTFGPLAAAVPALIAAAQQEGNTLWAVAGLYLGVQTLEAYVVTPLVHSRTVHLPPVVTIFAQIFLGFLLGFIGLLVAVPLTAAIMVTVKMLYVEDALGDHTLDVAGEDEAQEQFAGADLGMPAPRSRADSPTDR
jgi:predicted PurR-regulated permease PerM